MHRVTAGITGVLCQLDADIPYGAELRRWVPGLAEPAAAATKRKSTSKAKSKSADNRKTSPVHEPQAVRRDEKPGL